MIKPIYYLYLSISGLFLGVIFYIFYNELIIIKFATRQPQYTFDADIQKKNFSLYYFNGNNMVKEEKELIQSSNKIKTTTYLITSWLNLLKNEKNISQDPNLQSVMINNSGRELFISFEKSLFDKNDSIRQKLHIIQSLFTTLSENKLGIHSIRFMINNNIMPDPHLDFSIGWPIDMFNS